MKLKGLRFVWHKNMLLGFIMVLLCTAVSIPTATKAAPSELTGPGWIVATYQEYIVDGTDTYGATGIRMLNTYTNKVYGPFLVDEFAVYDEITGDRLSNSLFDVVVTPDYKTAIVSDFGNSLIHFVDISEPLKPTYLSRVKIDMFAEDLALSPDGHFVLVTDGGFAPHIYVIDVQTRTTVYQLVLPSFPDFTGEGFNNGYANAVDIAPDGTVIVADYFNGSIHTLLLEEDGKLTFTGTHRYYLTDEGEITHTFSADIELMRPVNVAIAPDGQTVLVSNVGTYTDTTQEQYTKQYEVGVFQITTPGEVEYVDSVINLPRAMQTITFNESGDKAYMSGNAGYSYDKNATPTEEYLNDGLYVLDVLGPGEVVFNPDESADLLHYTSSQLFGVDGIAVYEGNAYVSYPTNSLDGNLYPVRFLSVVDLRTFELTQVYFGLSENFYGPIGLGVRPFYPKQVFLPILITGSSE
ncbi:MAG: hypothetical protein CVU39_08900 [Chloroflexi bacterium HGW-Chloroflexi-10]|nr:MAG: hypothetical protein CVU39_08900 [Chloroflexi bacterium HGW-Chloroflexi-10]